MKSEAVDVKITPKNSNGTGPGISIIKHAISEINKIQKMSLTRLYRLKAFSSKQRSFYFYFCTNGPAADRFTGPPVYSNRRMDARLGDVKSIEHKPCDAHQGEIIKGHVSKSQDWILETRPLPLYLNVLQKVACSLLPSTAVPLCSALS